MAQQQQSKGSSSSISGCDEGESSSSSSGIKPVEHVVPLEGSSKWNERGKFTPLYGECWVAAERLPAAEAVRDCMVGGWAKQIERQQQMQQEVEAAVDSNVKAGREVGGSGSQNMETITLGQVRLTSALNKKGKGYRGVRLTASGRYKAEISSGVGSSNIHLGVFSSEIEAAVAFDEAAVALRGSTFFPRRVNFQGGSRIFAGVPFHSTCFFTRYQSELCCCLSQRRDRQHLLT